VADRAGSARPVRNDALITLREASSPGRISQVQQAAVERSRAMRWWKIGSGVVVIATVAGRLKRGSDALVRF
jgi:uncharacterized protein YgiM (DUF1202 family)